MNEHSFAKKIVTKCRQSVGIAWKINDNYAGGVPDALFISPSSTLWVEFKFTQKLPIRDETIVKPNLSRPQLSWIRKLQENKQPVIVVLGTPKYAFVFTSIESMENGIRNKDLQGISHNELIELITQGQLSPN